MKPSNPEEPNARIERLEAALSRVHAQQARRQRHRTWLLVALVTIPTAAYASTLNVPFLFSNGTIANANEVNANFAAAEAAVDDNDSRIASIEAAGPLHGVVTVSNSGTGFRVAFCTIGTTVIGGGCSDNTGSGQLSHNNVSGNGWRCESRHYSNNSSLSVTATAICADSL
jgi:hypothetical protein